MFLQLTAEQKLIQETARHFATSELEPVAALLDQGLNRQIFFSNLQRLAKLGFMGLNISETYGGTAAGAIASSLAITELARACAATAVTVSVNNLVAEVIQSIGSEKQCQTFLPRLCSGDYPAGAFALTEAGAGSDPAAMTTSAKLVGKHWVLNGSKVFITSAAYAGIFITWAVTDPLVEKGKGISCFLVQPDAPGLDIGQPESKMGQRAATFHELSFQDCRIPESALLGTLNDGYRIAISELTGGRIGIGALALGVGLAAMEFASRYAQSRKQFDQPIADFQGIQWKIADTYTELEAARLLLLNAAFKKERGQPFSKEASMAKLYASEAAIRACYEAQQILGGYGYTEAYPVERYARDVRVTSIYEGTSEIQRLIIAREVLNSFT